MSAVAVILVIAVLVIVAVVFVAHRFINKAYREGYDAGLAEQNDELLRIKDALERSGVVLVDGPSQELQSETFGSWTGMPVNERAMRPAGHVARWDEVRSSR